MDGKAAVNHVTLGGKSPPECAKLWAGRRHRLKGTGRMLDKRHLLARHLLFRGLDARVLEEVLALSVTKHLTDGDVLFLRGEPGTGLYGVLGGSVKITVSSPTGKELMLGVMGPGEVFGEIALLDGGPRTANAVALGSTMLLVVPHLQFRAFLARRPELCLYFLGIMCERIRATNARLEDVAFLGMPARLAKVLLNFAAGERAEGAQGTTIRRRLSQQALGQLVGSSRESVNKQLQAWRKAGWIGIERGRITIHQAGPLERAARTPAGSGETAPP
jgi:CRP/FNR family cyclic AMP-dependent transcriptional regulator